MKELLIHKKEFNNKIPKIVLDNIIHYSQRGARTYNTFSEDSDYDYDIIYINPTFETLSNLNTGLTRSINIIDGDSDYRIDEIANVFRLLSISNPNVVQTLYTESVINNDILNDIKKNFFELIFDSNKYKIASIHMAKAALKKYDRTNIIKHSLEAIRILLNSYMVLSEHKQVNDIMELIKPHEGSLQEKIIRIIELKRNKNNMTNQVEETESIVKNLTKKIEETEEFVAPNIIENIKLELYKIRLKWFLDYKK